MDNFVRFWWTKLCNNIRSASYCWKVTLFDCHIGDNVHNSLTFRRLPKHYNYAARQETKQSSKTKGGQGHQFRRGVTMYYLWWGYIIHCASYTVLWSEGEKSLQRFLHADILWWTMNLRNYEITAICDFRLSSSLGESLMRDDEEKRQQSTPASFRFGRSAPGNNFNFSSGNTRLIRILFSIVFNCPFYQQTLEA